MFYYRKKIEKLEAQVEALKTEVRQATCEHKSTEVSVFGFDSWCEKCTKCGKKIGKAVHAVEYTALTKEVAKKQILNKAKLAGIEVNFEESVKEPTEEWWVVFHTERVQKAFVDEFTDDYSVVESHECAVEAYKKLIAGGAPHCAGIAKLTDGTDWL